MVNAQPGLTSSCRPTGKPLLPVRGYNLKHRYIMTLKTGLAEYQKARQ